jgi:hypothetical protein
LTAEDAAEIEPQDASTTEDTEEHRGNRKNPTSFITKDTKERRGTRARAIFPAIETCGMGKYVIPRTRRKDAGPGRERFPAIETCGMGKYVIPAKAGIQDQA